MTLIYFLSIFLSWVLVNFLIVLPLFIFEVKSQAKNPFSWWQIILDILIIGGGVWYLFTLNIFTSADGWVILFYMWPLTAFFGYIGPIEEFIRYSFISLFIIFFIFNLSNDGYSFQSILNFSNDYKNFSLMFIFLFPGFRIGHLIYRLKNKF